LPASVDAKRVLIDCNSTDISIFHQCELVGLSRSTYYLVPVTESEENLALMRLIDEQYLKTPFYGSRRMTAFLERRGEVVNRKRVQRLMALMGLEGLAPGGGPTSLRPMRGPFRTCCETASWRGLTRFGVRTSLMCR
jgi:putative transposase